MAIRNVESLLIDHVYIAALEQLLREFEARIEKLERDLVAARG